MALAVSPNDESATAKLSRKAGAVELIGDQNAIEEVVTTLQAFDAAVAGKSWQSLATDTSAKGISARHRMLLAHAAVEVSRAKDEWLDHLAREKVEREQLAKGMMEFAQLFSRESGKAAQLRAQLEASAWAKESAPPREEDEVMDEAEDVLFSANVEEGAAPGVGGGCGDNPACTTAMGAKGTGQASSVYGGAVSACAAFEQRTGAGPSSTVGVAGGGGVAGVASGGATRQRERPRRWPESPPLPGISTQTSSHLSELGESFTSRSRAASVDMLDAAGGTAGSSTAGPPGLGSSSRDASMETFLDAPESGLRGGERRASNGTVRVASMTSQAAAQSAGPGGPGGPGAGAARWRALGGATAATITLQKITAASARASPRGSPLPAPTRSLQASPRGTPQVSPRGTPQGSPRGGTQRTLAMPATTASGAQPLQGSYAEWGEVGAMAAADGGCANSASSHLAMTAQQHGQQGWTSILSSCSAASSVVLRRDPALFGGDAAALAGGAAGLVAGAGAVGSGVVGASAGTGAGMASHVGPPAASHMSMATTISRLISTAANAHALREKHRAAGVAAAASASAGPSLSFEAWSAARQAEAAMRVSTWGADRSGVVIGGNDRAYARGVIGALDLGALASASAAPGLGMRLAGRPHMPPGMVAGPSGTCSGAHGSCAAQIDATAEVPPHSATSADS